MIWDTTKHFCYDKNIRKIYISNFKSSRKNYFKIIEKLQKKFKNIDCVSPLGERNNYFHSFHYIHIRYIKNYKKKNRVKKIISDNIFN